MQGNNYAFGDVLSQDPQILICSPLDFNVNEAEVPGASLEEFIPSYDEDKFFWTHFQSHERRMGEFERNGIAAGKGLKSF